MPTITVTEGTLDQVLALQIMVAWAGEGICEPKRLDWWRTDLIDEFRIRPLKQFKRNVSSILPFL